MQRCVYASGVYRMLYFVECGVIQRSVRVQVENTGDTNYPFLHGIIAVDRDNGDHARVLYKSFTKEKTLSRNIIELGISAMALLVIAYTRNTSRIKIINQHLNATTCVDTNFIHRFTRIQDNNLSNFSLLIFTVTSNISLLK